MFEMHEYIQKIVDELERDYEPSEWVESILKEMQNIAIRETDAKWQAKLEELQKQLNEYMFVAETIDEMYVKEVQKSDELQKRVEWLEDRLKATDALSKMRAAVIGSFNSQEFNARTRRKMMILKRAEQALKGEG